MDNQETALVVALVALSIGVAVGWCMRHDKRRMRPAGAASTAAADAGQPIYSIPVGAGCCTPCRSS